MLTTDLVKKYGSIREASRQTGIPYSTLQERHSKLKSNYKVLAIGDSHDSPSIPKDRFKWIGRLAEKERPEHIVHIGDIVTLDSLSTHDGNGTIKGRNKPTFEEDMASFKEALDNIENEISYSPKKHITLGNHEQRIFRFENDTREVQGMLKKEFFSILKERGWSWTDYGEWYSIEKVKFTHVPLNVMGKPYGGKSGHSRIGNDALHDVVYGHTHVSQYVPTPKLGELRHNSVVNLGCSLPWGHVEDYAKHNLSGWWWGVTILTITEGKISGVNFIDMKTLEREFANG